MRTAGHGRASRASSRGSPCAAAAGRGCRAWAPSGARASRTAGRSCARSRPGCRGDRRRPGRSAGRAARAAPSPRPPASAGRRRRRRQRPTPQPCACLGCPSHSRPAPRAPARAPRARGGSAVRRDVGALGGGVRALLGIAAHLGGIHLVGLAVARRGTVALLLGGEGVGFRVPAVLAVLGVLDQFLLGLLEPLGLALAGLLERPPLLFPSRLEITFFHGLPLWSVPTV